MMRICFTVPGRHESRHELKPPDLKRYARFPLAHYSSSIKVNLTNGYNLLYKNRGSKKKIQLTVPYLLTCWPLNWMLTGCKWRIIDGVIYGQRVLHDKSSVMENSNNHLDVEKKSERSETVDLNDNTLQVDISDALSEREKVKFTVHTKTTLKDFAKQDFSVVRQHEEFIWLHDRFEENESYAGYIIPPPPPRPDFDSSREKLQKLGEGEGSMTAEEFKKMKQELEAEYLATFKKTVAMHEVFLCRLANHPIFRADTNFRVFLEYEQDLSVRGKNKKEKLETFLRSFSKTTDEILLGSTQKDVDEFFDKEKNFLLDYHSLLKDATVRADKMTKAHKDVADHFIKISSCLLEMATADTNQLERFATKTADIFEKARKIENRVSTDEDLKLSDTLRYYMRDTTAAKNLLYRRLRCLADYEGANRALEKARAKNKDVHAAEWSQHQACEKFEQMSAKGKEELIDFKVRRVAAIKKNLVELCELELKHANVTTLDFFIEILKLKPLKIVFSLNMQTHSQLLKASIAALREEL
uniref:EOG090X05NC n=1 Tax=Daphnia hispanica TaxID=575233 RepID=A0A4Y7M6S4_9CRUS|nr:EOG090X05NC [Daphnia hispanica]